MFASFKADFTRDMSSGFSKMGATFIAGLGGQMRRFEQATEDQFRVQAAFLEDIKSRLRKFEGDTCVFKVQLDQHRFSQMTLTGSLTPESSRSGRLTRSRSRRPWKRLLRCWLRCSWRRTWPW